MKRQLQDYKSIIEPVWCPGCGDYGVLRAVEQALHTLDILPEQIAAVSGIGCSGRLSHYLNAYSLHGTHGRAIPTAVGVKVVRPDLTVLAVGGDGDGLGIGGGHIPHAARKNVDITYLLLDNRIYGLTKGQASPTTPVGLRTKTSPMGVYEDPLNAMAIFLAYDVSFVARATSFQVKELTEVIAGGIQHKGLSIVYIMSPCQTFPVLNPKEIRRIFAPLPEAHDRTDKMKAMEMAYRSEPLLTGIFYQVERPSLEDRLQDEIQRAEFRPDRSEREQIQELLYGYA